MFIVNVSFTGSPAHNGGVYAVAWSPDSKSLLSASGDKTCKTWDVAKMSLITEFPMGSAIEDQQVSCLWQGSHMLSVSLAGHISYLDPANPSKPLRILKVLSDLAVFCFINSNITLVDAGTQQANYCHDNQQEL